MKLVNQLEMWFEKVIDAQEFTLALDSTGVYMFRVSQPSQKFVDDAYQVLDILALNEDEAKLIFITETCTKEYDPLTYEVDSVSDFVLEVFYKDLDLLVRKLKGAREVCLSAKDIHDIEDCFYDVVEQVSPFQQNLVDLGIDNEIAKQLVLGRPMSLIEVKQLGCPLPLVETVFEMFKEYYKANSAEGNGVILETNNYVTIEKNAKRFNLYCGIGFVSLLAFWIPAFFFSGPLLPLKIGFNIVTCVICVVNLSNASKQIKLMPSVLAKVSFVASLIIFLVTVLPYVWKGAKILGSWIYGKMENNVFDPSWFDNLHW